MLHFSVLVSRSFGEFLEKLYDILNSLTISNYKFLVIGYTLSMKKMYKMTWLRSLSSLCHFRNCTM